MKDTADMYEDADWPGQQPGDAGTFAVVSGILAGDDPKLYAVFGPPFYGRWQEIVRELFEAQREGGQAGLLRRYLEIVYRDPGFALLMASHGMHGPMEPWRPEQLPGHIGRPPAAPEPQRTQRTPATPPAAPRRKLPQNWSAWDLLAGHYDQPPAKRHAVREEQVYAALGELGRATVAELARHTGQDRGNVHRRVQKLLEQGMIERHVTPNAIVYCVRCQVAAGGGRWRLTTQSGIVRSRAVLAMGATACHQAGAIASGSRSFTRGSHGQEWRPRRLQPAPSHRP